MREHLDELLARLQTLQEEIEEQYRQAREDLDRKRRELAGEFLRQQKRYKIGLLRFLAKSPLPVLLTAPVIYLGWIPFLLMDAFVSLYQAICFPVYRIPKVRRRDYIVFDREGLPYLNLIEKFNCFYCSYGNGVAAYTREVAARTEQYWCPIKHARRIHGAHDRYPQFFDHGDGEAFRQGIERLRRQYRNGRPHGTTPDQGAESAPRED